MYFHLKFALILDGKKGKQDNCFLIYYICLIFRIVREYVT